MKRFLIFLLCCLLFAGCAQPAPAPDATTTKPIQTTTEPEKQTETTGTTVPVPTEAATQPPTEAATLPVETIPSEATDPTEETPTEPETESPETQPEPTEPEPTASNPTEPEPTAPKPTEPATKPTEPTDPLTAYIDSMSLEQRVGQLFLARCPAKKAIEDIKTYHLGGFVLFARDFENETVSSISQTLAEYQAAAATPMLIAVDEEGGKVTRVSKYPAFRTSPFLSPREIYVLGGLDAIRDNEAEKSRLLSSLGINVNLSPVCDITTNPDAFMYSRSLGESPETTGRYVQTMLEVMNENGIGGVLKHFPGYGNNTDTHIAIAIDNRSLAELESCDLVPFRMGIDAGCGAIMVSHTFINALDEALPATLSLAVNRYLRNEMGFDGVVITDDLVMQAITDLYGAGESAVMAVLAGNDLLCSTEYQTQYAAVLEAVKNGRISESAINQSVERILKWKIVIGIFSI